MDEIKKYKWQSVVLGAIFVGIAIVGIISDGFGFYQGFKEYSKNSDDSATAAGDACADYGIKIITPPGGYRAENGEVIIFGSFEKDPPPDTLKLIITNDDTYFWLTSGYVTIDFGNNTWSNSVIAEDDFYVLVTLVGDNGRILIEYAEKVGSETERYPGVEELPGDIVECARAQVIGNMSNDTDLASTSDVVVTTDLAIQTQESSEPLITVPTEAPKPLSEISDPTNDRLTLSGGGGTNIVPWNNVGQSFIPKEPIITGVEVKISTLNEGKGSDSVTMELMTEDGEILGSSSVPVLEGFDGWLRFGFPNEGIQVTPGETYIIHLEDTGTVIFARDYNGSNTYPYGLAIHDVLGGLEGPIHPDVDFLFRVNP